MESLSDSRIVLKLTRIPFDLYILCVLCELFRYKLGTRLYFVSLSEKMTR